VAPDKPQSKSEVVATVDEIEQAIANLKRADLLKLKAFARNRAQALGFRGRACTGEDLLQDAVCALLEQRRHWNPKKVDFVGVLLGAIRSMASNLNETAESTGYEIPASKVVAPDEDGKKALNPVELLHSKELNPEQAVIASNLLAEVQEAFDDDPEAFVVMDGWSDRMSGTEIIDALGIDRKAYETIVRRIRRLIAARWPKGIHNVR
jgi:DNA-directed RNA polymerase specialized sigma24 family protein